MRTAELITEINRRIEELAKQPSPGASADRRDELRVLRNWVKAREGKAVAPELCGAVYDPKGSGACCAPCLLAEGHAGTHSDRHGYGWNKSRAEIEASP